MMLYGIEHPLGQTGSAAQVIAPLSFSPIPSLHAEGGGQNNNNKKKNNTHTHKKKVGSVDLEEYFSAAAKTLVCYQHVWSQR